MARLDADIDDKEIAGYADCDYWIFPERLKLEAGVRYAEDTFSYYQLNYGQFGGRLPDNPTAVTKGVAKSNPLAPKFSLEYTLAPDQTALCLRSQGLPRRRREPAGGPVDLRRGPDRPRHHRQPDPGRLRSGRGVEL
ncbi:MAG: hypothetical protein WDN45_04105 [Caulobacteraceae bacterium]